MKKKRFSVEQIVGVLKQAEFGVPVSEVIWKAGISEQTDDLLAMMTAQCCDPFSCPAITAACQMTVSIQDAAMTSSLEMRANTTTASINSREVCVLH